MVPAVVDVRDELPRSPNGKFDRAVLRDETRAAVTLHPTIAAFGLVDGQLAVGGIPLDRLAERVGSTPFFAYDRRTAHRAGRARCARRCPTGVDLSYAVKANPMPAVVQHLRRTGRRLRRRLGRRAADRARHADAARARQLRRARARRVAELGQAVAAGVTIELESETEARRVARGRASGSAYGRASPSASTRTSRIKGSGMRMGGGPQQFGVDAEQVPALLAELDGGRRRLPRLPRLRRSQNLNADVIAEAQQQTVDARARSSRSRRPAPSATSTSAAASASRTSTSDEPLDLAAVAEQLSAAARRRGSARAPGRAGRRRARPLHRRRVRRLRHPRRRPEGLPRPALPRGRRRAASPARRFRQLRPGHPPELPGRDRQPRRRRPTTTGVRRGLPLHAARPPRRRRATCPRADIGDLVVVFQAGAYGLTASPTAFLGHPEPVEVLV